MTLAVTVPTKGSTGRFTVDKAVDFIEEVGDANNKIIVKTDQEPAIRTFTKDLIEARPENRTIAEESPVKSSGSNGKVERAVQTVEAQIRGLLLTFETQIGRRVDPREPIVSHIPEYASFLLNRLKVGKDGRTAYERCKGKKATILGLEFGEKVLYKVRTEAKMAKLRSRWEYGIFIGVRQRSHEIWIATPDKTFAARSVRRIPEEERWGNDCVTWVRRPMWNR